MPGLGMGEAASAKSMVAYLFVGILHVGHVRRNIAHQQNLQIVFGSLTRFSSCLLWETSRAMK